MRVTNNAFSGAFLNSYNSLLSNYLKSQTKILTQRKYNRASEDSASAAKAAHVRKSLENLDIFDENLKTAKDFFYAAEDALYDVADKTYLNIKQKIVSIQDTMDQTELDAIALELEQQASHIIQDMNTDFATRQMFGSASSNKTPFTVYSRVEITTADGTVMNFGSEFDADGKVISGSDNSDNTIEYSKPDPKDKIPDKIVCYNDIPVNLMGDELKKAVNGSTIKYYDDRGKLVETKNVKYPSESGGADGFPGSKPIYVDIGLGVKYDENGTINPATALDMSLNGAEITGCGTDDNNDSLNLIQLVYDTASALRKGDVKTVNRYIDKLEDANTKVLNAITTLGVKQNNLQMYIDRNDVYRISLSEKQNTLEGV
ncbi:MAG: flagellin, partial [Huintestinicola sp.]